MKKSQIALSHAKEFYTDILVNEFNYDVCDTAFTNALNVVNDCNDMRDLKRVINDDAIFERVNAFYKAMMIVAKKNKNLEECLGTSDRTYFRAFEIVCSIKRCPLQISVHKSCKDEYLTVFQIFFEAGLFDTDFLFLMLSCVEFEEWK